MKKLTVWKKIRFGAFAAVGIALAVSAPSYAAGIRDHGFRGGRGGGAVEHHGFEGRHFQGHDFDRHHFDGHFGFGFVPVLPYYPPEYPPDYAAPSYWYYCPSYGAYYPSVTSCPEPWVTVPAD